MNTLATERPGTETPRLDFKALLDLLIKAFGPAFGPSAAGQRSHQEDRALRRELWMLGGG